MRLRFLGTGTSFGVPVVGCDCPICTSENPRNRRARHGLLLEGPRGVLLVDTPPELRTQLLREGIEHVDAVFMSHLHADHVHGIDDLRIFSMRGGGAVPLYIAREHASELRQRFAYIFEEAIQPAPGTSAPNIELREFEPGEAIDAGGHELATLAFPHGGVRSIGFRTGGLGVVVDGKEIPPEARIVLEGVDVLVINALWWGRTHPTHFNVEEAVAAIQDLGARRAYLTHLTHRLDYDELRARLPAGIEPAYDGLHVEIDR